MCSMILLFHLEKLTEMKKRKMKRRAPKQFELERLLERMYRKREKDEKMLRQEQRKNK